MPSLGATRNRVALLLRKMKRRGSECTLPRTAALENRTCVATLAKSDGSSITYRPLKPDRCTGAQW